jgi:hypothetical protein
MRIFVAMILLFSFSLAQAGESGVIIQGKTYMLYKDGKKVGDLPPEATRKPQSLGGMAQTLEYELDSSTGIICYSVKNDLGGDAQTLSCIKK